MTHQPHPHDANPRAPTQPDDQQAIAEGIQRHGPAFAAWADLVDETTPPGTLDHQLLTQFEDYYLGSYMTTQQWAQQETQSLGLEDPLNQAQPPTLRPNKNIDNQNLAPHHEQEGDITVIPNPEGGVWVFRSF